MINRLPEKLLILRKHFGFSQQELANKMGVNVVEYMGWENGRAICNLAQFKRLATIFQISLDDMLENSIDVQLPSLGLEDSIEIPFLKGEEDVLPGVPLGMMGNSINERTAQMNKVTPIEQRVQETAKQPIAKPVKTINRVDQTTTKTNTKKSNSKLFAILGGIFGVLLLALLIFYFMNSNGNQDGLNLKLNQTERLTLSETYAIYVKDDGSVVSTGQSPQLTEFKDVVQISSRSNFAVGLKKDGTLVATGSNTYGQLNVTEIKNAIDVAAGSKHTVAALEDGTVACVGDESLGACDVKEWKDIVDVEAGAGFTLGIDSTGSVFVSGNVANSQAMTAQKNIKKIAVGNSEVAFLTNDQTVMMVPLSGSATNVTSFKNITQVAVGNGFVIGLGSDGKVQISTTKDELKKIVSTWTGVGSIAANGDTIVAYTTSGILVGAGANSYSVYQYTSTSGEVVKLATVSNVQVSQDKTKVKITWDKVEGADYYEVKISTNPEYVVKSVEGTLSVDQSKFQDGNKYTITITATSNTNKELNSDPFTTEYTYTMATAEPTATPQFSLTINYVYDDNGSTAYQQFTGTFKTGDAYSVKSPVIDGFKPSVELVEGTMNDKNIEITVRYLKKSTPTPTPVVTPTPTPTPAVTTEEGCIEIGGTWNAGTSTCTK